MSFLRSARAFMLTLIFSLALISFSTWASPAAPNNAPLPQTGTPPNTSATASPAGPTAAPPANFVVVQTSYLEQLANSQKAALDAVSATSQSAINAAKDKEQWMVTC